MTLTLQQLKEWKAICEKATEGPWLDEPTPKDADGWSTCSTIAAVAPGKSNGIYAQPKGGISPHNNKVFIIAARTAMPTLLDELIRRIERE